MRATVLAAFAATVLLARFTAAQEAVWSDQPPVDLGHLVIEGAETFTAEQISRALSSDLDVAVAKILPVAGGQQRSIVEKAIAGYQHAGFPRVEVSFAAGANVLTIDEGPRFMAGVVRVEGAMAIDAARLIDALKPPATDESASGPYWPSGQPAWFDQATAAHLAEGIAMRLAEQGYYRPTFFLRTECDETHNTADLVVELTDEGQPSTVADLIFVGNQKNSREEIMAFLGMGSESILTGELRKEIASRLDASGRFVRCEWTLDELAQRTDGWQPKLSVEEYLIAPSLGETLAREEAALIQFSQWVASFDSSDDEITISFHGAGEWTDVVIAPREGFLALNGVCGDLHQASPFRAAVVMSEKQVGLYSLSQRRKIVAVPPPAHMTAQGLLTVVGGAPRWDGRSAFMVGAGMHSKARNGTRRHLKLQLAQTASAALSVVRKHQASCSWEGAVLTARWNERTLRVDATDGRLVEHIVVDQPKEDVGAEQATDGASVVRTWTARGEYARRLAQIEAATLDFENRADAKRPLSCVAELVCDELKAQSRLAQLPACQRALPVAAKLSAHGLLKPLDDLLLAIKEPAGDRFWIPAPPGTITRFHDVPSALKWLATYLGLWSGDSLFGDKSWLADVWRGETILLARGQLATPGSFGDHAPDVLSSPRGGPLWALAVAQMLHWQSLDTAATGYAQQGLRMLSARDFRRDYRELLSGNTLASHYLLGMVETLRALDSDEIKMLTDALVELGVLSDQNAQHCGAFLNLLHAADQLPTGQAIAHALDRCWKFGLSGWVDERLQHLADLPYSEAPDFAAPGQPASAATAANTRYGAATGPGSAGAAANPYGIVTYNSGENDPRVYSPARPTPLRYRTGVVDDSADALSAADDGAAGGGDVREQVERLQAWVRSLADRLAELESRLPPEDDADNDSPQILQGEKRANAEQR